ncbi:carbohydrate ABC transporter permease [Ornithinimicrobium murale]|uniref:carbohydrate ABC transporter permease n=1 Tax=Ornithinimicrobium murale TaxID=1050153 RepID=UPI001EDCF776|nr:carbohydrate ABC transporter permease [Ornithinimicrobium murale]
MSATTAPHEHRGVLSQVSGYLAMLVVVLVIALPLYWIVAASLKERPDIYTVPVTWFPDPVTLENYDGVRHGVPFLDFLRNSVLITTVLTVVQVVLGVLSAFALSFLRFPGRTVVLLFIIAALMVPSQITWISNYALVAQLGWRNTFAGIIIPLAGVAFGTFLLRNHFVSLPTEIIEAAEMDHAGALTLLWRVVLPMSWPTVIAFTLITIVNEWNQYLWPLLMADDSSTAPLPVGLTQLQDAEGFTNWGPVMAGTVLTMLPVLVVFLVLQRHMIKGLTAGAVKG